MADEVHFTNIVYNLVDNACKYSGGQPKITIETSSKEGGVLIKVIDNGIGISPQHQKYIFDKFYRVPTGDVHDVKGFGLGLYYVKIMVTAHGGKIQLNSRPGKGSIFEIFLPNKLK